MYNPIQQKKIWALYTTGSPPGSFPKSIPALIKNISDHRKNNRLTGLVELYIFIIPAFFILTLSGCGTPRSYRLDVDQKAHAIIEDQHYKVLKKQGSIQLERPGDILRRQLISQFSLPIAGPASEGSDQLAPIDHWPEQDYPAVSLSGHHAAQILKQPLTLSLFQALEAGAKNSSDYQDKKEAIFQAALDLYLEQETFRNSLAGQIKTLLTADNSETVNQHGSVITSEADQQLQFKNGTTLTTALALDLATLFTGGTHSSMGIAGDASLSIPLLRGAADHVVTEPLKQAERNLTYAILEFEQFKKEFAVAVGSKYLNILKQMDTIKNAEEDYRSRIVSARRSSRLADAGRLKEIEVDQAIQTELIARQRWISARENLKKQMDEFKKQMGLPPDASIELDAAELKHLVETSPKPKAQPPSAASSTPLPADAAVSLMEPDNSNAGPWELNSRHAILLALENRLDMKVALGKVYDAQRQVTVAADGLGAELTLLGTASIGERRTISTADLANARLRTKRGIFSALLTLDLPFERTTEAVAYRKAFIELEKAVREVQSMENDIKLAVRNRLRALLEARETLLIQTQAVSVASKRVKSITLFMDAGRAETRDLLEAQDALLSAQNSLTAARVNYRIAELSIQRDMGLLAVSDDGLWQEYYLRKKNVQK